jgi:methylthioribulose-1-phosphate dehydratase
MNSEQARQALSSLGKDFYNRGWMYGTSGNLSCRVEDELAMDMLAITASGVDKGRLKKEDILVYSPTDGVPEGHLRPSAETSIHDAVYRARPEAGAVLHVHTVESTIYSMSAETEGSPAQLSLTGYEMIKGLGVWEPGVTVQIPVFENHGDVPQIAEDIYRFLEAEPNALPVFLIRGHGLTSWGKNITHARHHLEIGHFLSACEIQRTQALVRS